MGSTLTITGLKHRCTLGLRYGKWWTIFTEVERFSLTIKWIRSPLIKSKNKMWKPLWLPHTCKKILHESIPCILAIRTWELGQTPQLPYTPLKKPSALVENYFKFIASSISLGVKKNSTVLLDSFPFTINLYFIPYSIINFIFSSSEFLMKLSIIESFRLFFNSI